MIENNWCGVYRSLWGIIKRGDVMTIYERLVLFGHVVLAREQKLGSKKLAPTMILVFFV